jgi:acetyl esterase
MRRLAPELASWLDDYNKLWLELERNGFSYTPQNAREGLANLTRKLVTTKPEIESIIDDEVVTPTHAIPVRIYQATIDNNVPILIYLHGGGHMSGSIEVYDLICQQLAWRTGHVVVAVEYRLAPEFPYPCGLEDAEQVIRNISSLLDRHPINYQNSIRVAGDSGGGAMTATLAHRLQHDPQHRIEKQVLIYPSLDYSMQHESITSNGRGYLLHSDKIEWFFAQYLAHNEDRRQVSPLYMEFSTELAQTLMVTAEFCPLRDEGFRYVEKLKRAGVAYRHEHFDDMIHAFLNMQDVVPEQCERLYQTIADFLCAD